MTTFRIVAWAHGFALIFGIAGAVFGFFGGLAWGAYYEATTGYGGGNGPMLMFPAALLGAVGGLFVGFVVSSRRETRGAR